MALMVNDEYRFLMVVTGKYTVRGGDYKSVGRHSEQRILSGR